jgi:hypothetical protein
MNTKKIFSFTILASSIVLLNPAFASDLYKYQKNGVTVYTDSIPENVNAKVDVLSGKTGILKKEDIQFSQTDYQQAIQKKQLDEKNIQESKQQLIKDQQLLNQYSNVQDIEKDKKNQLNQIDHTLQNDNIIKTDLDLRKKEIEKNLEKKPDSEDLQQQYQKIQNDIQQVNDNITNNKELYKTTEDKYDNNIKRYNELTKTLSKNN